METIVDQLTAALAEGKTLRAELDALRPVAEAHKTDLETVRAELAGVRKDLDAAMAKVAAAASEFTAATQERDEFIAVLTAEKAELTRKLTLAPFGDVTDGRADPVKAGGDAGNAHDWIAEVEKLRGKERQAFYRAHRAEIDAAYAARG